MVVPSDPWHAPATRILKDILEGEYRQVSTTDYVLAEAFDFIQARRGRPSAAENLHRLAFGAEGQDAVVDVIHRIHGARFARALDRYRREFARGLSLTDWTSVVVMEEQGIGAIATFDKGFRGLARTIG